MKPGKVVELLAVVVVAAVLVMGLAVEGWADCPAKALNCSCSEYGQCMWQTHPTVWGGTTGVTQWEMNGLGDYGQGKVLVIQISFQAGGQSYNTLQGVGNEGSGFYNHQTSSNILAGVDMLDVVGSGTATIPQQSTWDGTPSFDDGEDYYADNWEAGCHIYCGL